MTDQNLKRILKLSGKSDNGRIGSQQHERIGFEGLLVSRPSANTNKGGARIKKRESRIKKALDYF